MRAAPPLARSYYPEQTKQEHVNLDPFYYSDKQVRRRDKLQQLRLKGRGPPKKGEGKRSKRR